MHYQSDDNIQGPPYSLDHNHSHFILVDHTAPEEPDGTTKLRFTLEKYISEQRTGYGGKQGLWAILIAQQALLSRATPVLEPDSGQHGQDQVNIFVIV